MGTLAFFGREVVANVLALWTGVLYILFISYFIAAAAAFGGDSLTVLTAWEVRSGWAVHGLQYALYNLFIAPVVLYSTIAIQSTREAWGAATAAGIICVVPAALFHFTFLGHYPEVIAFQIPVYTILTGIGVQTLLLAYLVGLFGTFAETGAGLIHGVNERIDSYLRDRALPTLMRSRRALIAVAAVGTSAVLATVGIIPLIARGYGGLAWGFLVVYILPLLTVGVVKLRAHAANA